VDKAKERYQEIVKKYPKTEAAKEALKLLEKLNK
jgi:TolA-binding protein